VLPHVKTEIIENAYKNNWLWTNIRIIPEISIRHLAIAVTDAISTHNHLHNVTNLWNRFGLNTHVQFATEVMQNISNLHFILYLNHVDMFDINQIVFPNSKYDILGKWEELIIYK